MRPTRFISPLARGNPVWIACSRLRQSGYSGQRIDLKQMRSSALPNGDKNRKTARNTPATERRSTLKTEIPRQTVKIRLTF
jgi:hypothetical protein